MTKKDISETKLILIFKKT